METRITATELARNLSDILNRVRYRGERFVVERNRETVAVIEPPVKKPITLGEFLELWPALPKPDPAYWDDLEAVSRSQPPLPEPPSWDS